MTVPSDAFAGAFNVPQEPIIVTVTICPPLRKYTPEFEAQLKAEIAQLKSSAVLGKIVVDYKALRDACRAIGSSAVVAK